MTKSKSMVPYSCLHIKEALPRHIEEIFNFVLCEKFSLNFTKLKIKNFAKISRNYENENFAATLCTSGVRGIGGKPVQQGCTLRANADCALFVFLIYRFPFCHLLILWIKVFCLIKYQEYCCMVPQPLALAR